MKTLAKLVLLASLICAVTAQNAPQNAGQPAEVKKGRIEGSVVSSTGAPIPRATLRLIPSNPTVGATPALVQPVTATASDDGTFAFENLDPGTYNLQVQRPGFVNAIYGQRRPNTPGTPLVVAEGQTLADINISMTPQGVITGRVTDSNGDSLQGVMVMAMRPGYQRGQRTLLPAGQASSNDLGEYRIANLPPGNYTLAAVDRRAQILIAAQAQGQAGSREGNITTYFPNAADPQGSAPLMVSAGAELRGMDIRMRTGALYSISGKAVGPGGAPAGSTLLSVMDSDAASGALTIFTAFSRSTAQVRPDGSFAVNGLAPGRYIITTLTNAVLNGQPTPNLTGRGEFAIADSDLKDVVFQVGPGATLRGAVTVEDGNIETLLAGTASNTPAAISGSTVAIAAAAAGAVAPRGVPPSVGLIEIGSLLGNPPNARVSPDGTFAIERISPTRYGLVVGGLPQGYYVKSARQGGADVLASGLDFSSGAGGDIAIVLSNKAAEVTGVVRNSRGEAQPGAVVALWTAAPDIGSQTNGVRTAYADQNGTFRFQGLRPGDYFVAAFEDVETAQVQNRDLLQLLASNGEELKLAENGRDAKELRAISTDAVAQATAKLP